MLKHSYKEMCSKSYLVEWQRERIQRSKANLNVRYSLQVRSTEMLSVLWH